MPELSNLEDILGYKFNNPKLLTQAITHSSHSSKVSENYERLEFLGDRVLGLAVASLLYRIFSDEVEGNLSQRHTALVCKETVAEVARRLRLDEFIIGSEEICENENVLCDVCEAVIGAIFIDSHCERAIEFVDLHWRELIDKNLAPPKDCKTSLQEVAHSLGQAIPVYKVEKRMGTEHEPTFVISVSLDGANVELGEGRNKKLAEQEAACKMLKKLGYRHE